MTAAVVCVGRLREKGYAAAAEEYLKRLSRYGKTEIIELPDLPEPANASPADQRKVMEKEGESILSRIKPGDHVIALCVDAPQYDSVAFAARIAENEMRGSRQVFVIGGSLGLSQEAVDRADEELSLSKLTLPHRLARLVLLEQLYRSYKILNHETYHK